MYSGISNLLALSAIRTVAVDGLMMTPGLFVLSTTENLHPLPGECQQQDAHSHTAGLRSLAQIGAPHLLVLRSLYHLQKK